MEVRRQLLEKRVRPPLSAGSLGDSVLPHGQRRDGLSCWWQTKRWPVVPVASTVFTTSARPASSSLQMCLECMGMCQHRALALRVGNHAGDCRARVR